MFLPGARDSRFSGGFSRDAWVMLSVRIQGLATALPVWSAPYAHANVYPVSCHEHWFYGSEITFNISAGFGGIYNVMNLERECL